MKLAFLLAAALAAATSIPAPKAGLLVMAHGGDPEWDKAVHATLSSLGSTMPVEIAFGMADADSLQSGVERLEAKGVRRIGVVRLFVSGESFLTRTRKILGLEPGAPDKPKDHHGEAHGQHGHGGHAGFHDPDTMPLWRITTQSRIALSPAGLMDSDLSGKILADRAAALSKDPSRESVLIVGHGPGDEAENKRWLARMDRLADDVRKARPFKEVRVETLREDWPHHRSKAEDRIRAFVKKASEKGGRAVVVPLRVYGFGPYAQVLKGLKYASDGKGLIPHPLVGDWLRREAAQTFQSAGWPDAAQALH